MKPYCSRCFSTESDPVDTDAGCEVYWFKIDEDGEIITTGVDEGGEISSMFTGIVGKDFDYDESFQLLCSDCIIEMFQESGEFEEEQECSEEDLKTLEDLLNNPSEDSEDLF